MFWKITKTFCKSNRYLYFFQLVVRGPGLGAVVLAHELEHFLLLHVEPGSVRSVAGRAASPLVEN